MPIMPIGTRVLIKPQKSEEKSKGGVYLPEQARDKPVKGEVLAVGDDVESVREQQVVIYPRYSGVEVKDGDEKLLILKEEDLLAVIE